MPDPRQQTSAAAGRGEDRPPHPGRTPAQRKALDAIGCGDFTPRMARATAKALLDAGLIVPAGSKVVAQDRFGATVTMSWAMPIPVHMQWCLAVAATDEEMATFEAETAGREALSLTAQERDDG